MSMFTARISVALVCAIISSTAWSSPVPPAAPTPIVLSGYNADIVTDANQAVRFATPADIGSANWFETGAVDGGGTQRNDGLAVGNFTSAFTNTVTGGNTVFQLQPFNGNNALLLRYPNANIATLNLVTPRAYNNLAILAAGYNAASNGQGTLLINFADGTHSGPLSYNAFDWGFGQTGIALGSRGRNFNSGSNGTAFNYNKPVPFKMYETDLDLAALGLNHTPIISMTFTGGTISDQPGTPNHGPHTSIFAISGAAVPEPTSATLSAFVIVVFSTALVRRRTHKSCCNDSLTTVESTLTSGANPDIN